MALPGDNDATENLILLPKRHFKKRRYAASAELLEAYVGRRPSHGQAWWRYGNALRILGRKTESRRALLTAGRLTTDHKGSIAAQLAMLYEARGKRAGAEKWFARAAAQRDTARFDWVSLLRGVNFLSWGKFARAIACLSQAIEMRGCNEDDAHVTLGMVYRAQQRYDAAAAEFRAALRITPEHAEGVKGLASIDGIDAALTLIQRLPHGGA
jgi:tetratricopeptide (TPR) repeat protein